MRPEGTQAPNHSIPPVLPSFVFSNIAGCSLISNIFLVSACFPLRPRVVVRRILGSALDHGKRHGASTPFPGELHKCRGRRQSEGPRDRDSACRPRVSAASKPVGDSSALFVKWIFKMLPTGWQKILSYSRFRPAKPEPAPRLGPCALPTRHKPAQASERRSGRTNRKRSVCFSPVFLVSYCDPVSPEEHVRRCGLIIDRVRITASAKTRIGFDHRYTQETRTATAAVRACLTGELSIFS